MAPYARESADFLRGRLGQQGPAWPGPFTAEQTPQEEYGLGGVEDYYANAYESGMQPMSVDQYSRYLQSGAPEIAGQQQAATLGGQYLPGANPYLAQIEQGLDQDYEDKVADIQNRLALAGHGRESTAGALLGSRALAENQANRGRLRFGAYEAERGRMTDPRLMGLPMQALETGLTYPVSMAQALMQAGAMPRSLQQGELDRTYNEMLRLWNETYRAAGQAQPLFGQRQEQSTQYGPSPFMSLLGGAASFIPLMGAR